MSVYGEIPPEHDRIPARPIMYTILATIVTIIFSVFVVWAFLSFQFTGGGRSGIQELSLSIQTEPFPFEPTTPYEAWRATRRQELGSWQWADRARGMVRMPLDATIERYLRARGAR